MKIVLVFCLLAAFCTVHAKSVTTLNILDILRQGIEKSRSNVYDTINKLKRLRDNTETDIVSRSIQYLSNKHIMFIKFSDTMIKSIKNQMEAAKANGKNAQPCYDNAFNKFRDIKVTATGNANQCVNGAKSSIKNQLIFINDLISVGQRLITQLNSIFPNCFDNNIFQMQQCIALQLAQTNQLVKSWMTEADQAKWTAISASRNVDQQSSTCIVNVFQFATNQIMDATIVANICIKNF